MFKFFLNLLLLLLMIEKIDGRIIPITIEHARTREETEQGLMGRKFLNQNYGMLFHFPYPRKATFWMYNTPLDLSLAFLNDRQIIVEVFELKSYPDIKDKGFFYNHSVSSSSNVQYALEMNKNWFEINTVKPGDYVYWNKSSNKGYIYTNH
jgi:uncharacterized protein